jgi:uncharacterized membrane protein
MKLLKAVIIVCVAVIVIACGHSERKAHKAQAKSSDSQSKIAKERLNLVEDYKKCIKNAGEDKNKIEACDSYLKAAESLK